MQNLLSMLASQGFIDLVWIVAQIFAVIVPLLIAVAYLTLAERRVIGLMQLRRGRMLSGLSACSSLLLMH